MDKKKRIGIIAAAAVALIVVIYLFASAHSERTDDAFIEANAIPISAKVPGYVITLNVNDNQAVKKGDVMVVIDPRDYEIALSGAKARLANAQSHLKRQESMNNAARSIKDLEDAQMAAATAQSEFDQAQKNLDDSKIVAPDDGVVTRRGVEQGAYVQPGEELFALVTPTRWVIANYKETQLTDMRPGQSATIRVDAYPHLKLKGHVDSIQHGTGARFSAFPPENATGNYVKIVQRVPVKIAIDEVPDDVVLGPGMSVEPTVDTSQ